MAARITLNAGDVFAGYTIESMLGEGGMGTVYRARDPDLPRSVALKLLHRDLTANDYIRSRFELEAAHAARLEHPNIVTVYRRGREDDQLWIAMQFIDTTDAAAAVADGPLEPARALYIVLSGCWRGISPSKRNVLWLILPGVAIGVAAIVFHTYRGAGPVPVLGEGWGGLIAGIALTAAGVMLAVRRSRGGTPDVAAATQPIAGSR